MATSLYLNDPALVGASQGMPTMYSLGQPTTPPKGYTSGFWVMNAPDLSSAMDKYVQGQGYQWVWVPTDASGNVYPTVNQTPPGTVSSGYQSSGSLDSNGYPTSVGTSSVSGPTANSTDPVPVVTSGEPAGGAGTYSNGKYTPAGGGTGGAGTYTPPADGGGASPFDFPGYDQWLAQIQSAIGSTQNRTAPQSAAVAMSPLRQFTAPTIGPAAQSAGVQVAPGSLAAAGALGPAAQAAYSSAFRAQQLAAAEQERRWMMGEESVSAQQLRESAAMNMRQQYGLAASARPGDTALGQRIAAQQAGQIGAGLANQQAIAGIQERQSAAGILGNIVNQGRTADENVNMFNAGQTNDLSKANALNSTNASIANARNSTDTGIAQGNLSGNINMFNAGQKNDLSKANALNATTAGVADMQSANTYAYNSANLAQSNNQFNVTAGQTQQTINDTILAKLIDSGIDITKAQQAGTIENQKLMELYTTEVMRDNVELQKMGQQGWQIALGMAQGFVQWLALKSQKPPTG